LLLILASLAGCGKKDAADTSTPTRGSIAVYASPSITEIVQKGADAFNRQYPEANVNVYPVNSRAIVDSLINGRTNWAYLDRSLSEEESLAVTNTRDHVYSFLLGSTVATWIVHPDNPLVTLDSLQILRILTGEITSWKSVGGGGGDINVYLPPLGDGAWMSLVHFYGIQNLNEVNAHYWPTDSLVMANVAQDRQGLGLVGFQVIDRPGIKKVKWRNPLLADPVPANIGTLQQGRYPFQVRLKYYTIAERTDLAAGFLSFMAANPGQKILADNGFLPAQVPVRIVNLTQ